MDPTNRIGFSFSPEEIRAFLQTIPASNEWGISKSVLNTILQKIKGQVLTMRELKSIVAKTISAELDPKDFTWPKSKVKTTVIKVIQALIRINSIKPPELPEEEIAIRRAFKSFIEERNQLRPRL